jgi:hypothetical protein
MLQNEGLDQFYTIPSISKKCLKILGERYNWSRWDLIVEPSAGGGSFFTQIPSERKIGIDISPTHNDIVKQDFLTYEPPTSASHILVVGNPPFGRVSSLAIKFFNHASKWAHMIAFIVPRTFRRVSVHNKLDLNFHLVFDEDIPMNPCSFEPPMMAKCCFQIWEKNETTKRLIVQLSTVHPHWDFLGFGPKDLQGQPTPPNNVNEDADIFALRAYGGKCGEIVISGLESLRPKSWHWIKSKIPKQTLIDRLKMLDYSMSLDTARQNSIGRGDLVNLYSDAYDDDACGAVLVNEYGNKEMLGPPDQLEYNPIHEKVEANKMIIPIPIQIPIPFNVTFLHTMHGCAFDNLSKEGYIDVLKDGRVFSHFIEPWLEQNYPSLKHIKGCKGYDLVDASNENIKYEQKTFTNAKSGCSFRPSNMKGAGRKFDQTIFEEKTKKLLFVIVSNIDFPNIKIKFISGNDLLGSYPTGIIPRKDFDKFFN